MSVPVGTKLPHREGGEGVFIVVQTREGNEERRPGPDNRDVTRGGGGGGVHVQGVGWGGHVHVQGKEVTE